MTSCNPTDGVDVSFERYVLRRREEEGARCVDGVPDYAYAADFAIQRKIRSLPGFFPFFRVLTNQVLPLVHQQINRTALKVGPQQFSDIYALATSCARRLGIGIPSVFIVDNPGQLNAYTIATDDQTPLIVLHSALVERLTPAELLGVIGHECGHIHNNHGVFTLAIDALTRAAENTLPLLRQAMALLSFPARYLLLAWSRAAEVTGDRAGVICSRAKPDMAHALAKMVYGGAYRHENVDINALLEQFDAAGRTPVRLLELGSTHPITTRRILAIREFLSSATLYAWRPEWKSPDTVPTAKQDLDERCKRYMDVLRSPQGA